GLACQEEIRRLEIAVNDPERMRARERVDGLEQIRTGLADLEPAAASQDAIKVLAVEVLHDDVRGAVDERTDIEDPHDVLTLHARGRARLAYEPLRGKAAGRIGAQKLERDALVQRYVARGIDDAPRALTQHPLENVLVSNHLAELERRPG